MCHEERRIQQRKVDHPRKRNRSEKDPTTSPAMPAALFVGLRPSWRPMVDMICDAPAVPPRNRNAIADASRTQARIPKTTRHTFAIRADQTERYDLHSSDPAFNPNAMRRTLAILAPHPTAIFYALVDSVGRPDAFCLIRPGKSRT